MTPEKNQTLLGKRPRVGNSSLLYQAAIILLGIIAGYFYYTQYQQDNLEPVVVTDIKADDSLSKFRDLTSLDFQVFTEPGYRTLKTIGELPVKPGSTGRADIFSPF